MKFRAMQIPLLLISFALLSLNSCTEESMDVQIVKIPDTSHTNAHYVSNRAPLKPSTLIKLPVGAIRPENWLRECLVRQSEGLTRHLGEISVWLQKEDNAWLSPDGEGKWGWEEVPYWLKGYANIGYILEDEFMIEEAKIWLKGVLNSQRSDGNFGPVSRGERDDPQDFWPNMIMLYCLQSYYDFSDDEKVIELMTRYFRYQLNVPEESFLSPIHYWARVRGGDNLHSVMWLYNRTGDQFLLELAEKIHRRTAPWASRGHDLDIMRNGHGGKKEDLPNWYFNLIDWHNVNIAQGFREPAQYYLLSHNEKDLQATYDDFRIVRDYFGQVPGGMFGADENARPGYDDPRQGIETCGMVEQMNSDEHLLRITGDIFWADHCEEVAFNSLPAAIMPDFRGLRYLTCPNMVESDSKNHWPALNNGGPFLVMNPFSSRCCQHNHTQGWPYFSENLWMATPDNGLAAVIYAASTVTAKVGKGDEISIRCKSNYPFEDQLEFTVNCNSEVECPLYFRIPAWCKSPTLHLNDLRVKIQPEAGKYIRIYRRWSKGDKIVLSLPKEIQVRTWTKNHNSLSVDYGPLTFSLKFDEKYVRKRE
jgi:hypothetical protein